jgi:methionine sulfoxide reductase heme-binding subunit
MTSQRKIALLRLVTLALLCLPAAELAWRWYFDRLGPLPATAATLATGDWAVIFLLLSLALTPARGVFEWPPLIHIRRRIGVAAALYALLHFSLFILDQNWNLIVVAQEIAKRFYLTIGFAALLILTMLALISTDRWQRRLKRNWKRLNLLVYPAAVLALVHFFLQSKINVGEATFAAGLFAWLMLWRLFPAKLRTTYLGLLLLAVAATVAALGFELAWYGLLKHIDPTRLLAATIDPELAPRPVHKVLLAAIAAIVAMAIRQLVRRIHRVWTKTLSDRLSRSRDGRRNA